MLQNRMKKLIAVLFIAVVSISVLNAADSSSLVNRYIQQANKAYEDGDIDTAYKAINAALTLSKTGVKEGVAKNVITTAQFIYKEKLNMLKRDYNGEVFVEMRNYLEQFPEIESSTIKKLKEQVIVIQEEKEKAEQKERQDLLNRQQEETLRQGQQDLEIRRNQADKMGEYVEAMRASTEANEKRQEEERKAQEENRRIQEESIRLQQESIKAITSGFEDLGSGFEESTNELKKANEQNRRSTKIIFFIVLGVVVLILIIVVIAVLLTRKGLKNQEIQQQQYVQAFKMLAANQHQTNRLMLGGITDLYGGANGSPLRIAGSSKWEPAALPDVEQSPEEQEELKNLAIKCEEIGIQIDQVTNRKNNSKNVSELVYKIAMHLGLPQGESMLYFCAAMIYDAGYLGVDPELFKIDELTDEQREILRSHVKLADNHLDFVPKKYWDIFDEAAKNHHENMDGTGYPSGLEGDKIPQVARIIRVCESFISMTSKRGYRATLDKESAIEKLREQPHFYDPDVIDILEQIV